MYIQNFPSGPFKTNAYVAACPSTRQAVAIDPAPGSSEAVRAYLKDNALKCIAILLTHSHWDHIADVSLLKEAYQIPVYVHPLDAPNLEQPGADGLPGLPSLAGVKPDCLLEDGLIIPVGNLSLQVIHTPGHSAGSVCFYEPTEKVLFSGDTLFKGTIGNISFPTSQPELIWSSLDKLAQLSPSTKVYPGHGVSTTIGKESWLPDAQKFFG